MSFLIPFCQEEIMKIVRMSEVKGEGIFFTLTPLVDLLTI
jgi:hypothetical protein